MPPCTFARKSVNCYLFVFPSLSFFSCGVPGSATNQKTTKILERKCTHGIMEYGGTAFWDETNFFRLPYDFSSFLTLCHQHECGMEKTPTIFEILYFAWTSVAGSVALLGRMLQTPISWNSELWTKQCLKLCQDANTKACPATQHCARVLLVH